MMIYLNIFPFHWTVGSSKADSPSGSPPIFISWHRNWHVMDQTSKSYYYLLSPIPPGLHPFSIHHFSKPALVQEISGPYSSKPRRYMSSSHLGCFISSIGQSKSLPLLM